MKIHDAFASIYMKIPMPWKQYSNRELALKVISALPKEWDVNTMAMRESKALNKPEIHDLFVNLKAYEFELETRAESDPSTSQPMKALTATIPEHSSPIKLA
ncbi:hypothetical protein F511_09091 [Dorcoceras hygrometricum]|nr:hypothetical protein F511_09091 [Dorcoceras hygrometricum]